MTDPKFDVGNVKSPATERTALPARLWVSLVPLALLLSLVLLTGCEEEGTAELVTPLEAAKPVQIEVASSRRYESYTHVPGLVEARSSMAISFRIPGTLANFPVEEGEYVEQGAVIAELDRRDYIRAVKLARAAVASAEARAADALRELEREKQLRSANSTSARRLDSARSTHQVAEADAEHARLELEAAQIALADCSLVAPVSGWVEKRLLEKHEYATPDMPVAILTELDTLKVKASVADQVLSALIVGSPATVRSSAWPGRVFEGRIARVAMAADAVTHTLPIEIEVANDDLALRPAMVVEVALQTGTSDELLTLPMNAVVRDGALRTLCFVVIEDGAGSRAEARMVSLGRLVGDRVAITAGLRIGERVIVRGQHFLREGDAVRVTHSVAAVDRSGSGS